MLLSLYVMKLQKRKVNVTEIGILTADLAAGAINLAADSIFVVIWFRRATTERNRITV